MITAEFIFSDLESYIYKEVRAIHSEKIALACSGAFFDCLWLNFRKGLMYVPTSDKRNQDHRYQAIWGEFNGGNHQELAVKYRLSQVQIYSIVKQMRSTFIRKNQCDLFPVSEEENNKPITFFVIEEHLPTDLIKSGLSALEAASLAQKISSYLCQNFPGVSVCITDKMRKKRDNNGQSELF